MDVILSIETATTNCSVALGKEGKLLALKEDYNNNYSHAERLHKYIDEILKESGLTPGDLSAVAVSKGPGSYTGLRIGVSAAKGLCFSLDLPLISIPTLTSLALQVDKNAGDFIIPLLDARRMEVYTAGFTSGMEAVFETRAQVLDDTSFLEYLEKGKVTFIGNGVEKFKKICSHKNASFVDGKLPSAAEMVVIASEKFAKKEFEDVAYFEPYYLKDFMAG
ncbi:tRNA threonylcarbamoyladenosine biosynthesis protein TsaB [Salinimicrobium catena]|uniref:tRNA threonylcarbamoyladenosine biosynthesis protein TsaB n=1 Tax=Salinimicrobium catena TaxID=390640 RepID=A0A1H5H409_9FLAO|nr:tRNA (adenosine(37)-N6)-threonylcarbamoyltransferase complex dimerization subunit type 1 TsaB [Salinimicrobium catena]SDK67618.1 tRNA threonylcarbamoyladenosine biosynthesis protein TsaB [Salinimicrobium catena]SEE22743.1 tRNA threonylcarbamoyladenosine biosynthesis protein TsaB [Salinimicrobium catena]